MGQREPIGELLNGLLSRGSVERHQRRRPAWRAHEIGAPPLRIDQHGLDLVAAPVDGLFDAVDGHVSGVGVIRINTGDKDNGDSSDLGAFATAKESAKTRPQGG